MTVGEIEARMTAREMNEWACMFKIENEEDKEREQVRRASEGLDDMRRVGFNRWGR